MFFSFFFFYKIAKKKKKKVLIDVLGYSRDELDIAAELNSLSIAMCSYVILN